jgi:hypothetical protein
VSAILEAVGVLALIVLVGAIVPRRSAPPRGEVVPDRSATVSDAPAPARHRWTKWQILDQRRIHLYGEVDEGRDLPDRIDVVLRRECTRCGLPQTKTIRGLNEERRG